MYNCEVCKRPSPRGQQKLVFKGVSLCKTCYGIVTAIAAGEQVPTNRGSVAAKVAEAIIASFEQPESSPPISWPRSCS